MVNKSGFLRILEASIAIILIISVLIVLLGRSSQQETEDLGSLISPIMQEISENSELRDKIISYDTVSGEPVETVEEIEDLVKTKLGSPVLDSAVRICPADNSVCSLLEFPENNEDGNIYSKTRVISTNPNSQDVEQKRLKIFLWRVSRG